MCGYKYFFIYNDWEKCMYVKTRRMDRLLFFKYLTVIMLDLDRRIFLLVLSLETVSVLEFFVSS